MASRRRNTQNRGLELELLLEPVREGWRGSTWSCLSADKGLGYLCLVPHLVELRHL